MNEWMNTEKVCETVGIGRSALYEMWQRGQGPRYSQVGRLRLVRADWLEDWLISLEVVA